MRNPFPLRFAGWLGLLILLPTLPATAAPPSIEDFVRTAQMRGVVVSPSNTHAALLVAGPKGRTALAVMELAQPKSIRVIVSYGNVDVVEVEWINDKRLAYEVREPGTLFTVDTAGTYAVDADGERQVELITWYTNTQKTGTQIRSRTLTAGWYLQAPVRDGSNDVLVRRHLENAAGDWVPRQVARLDTVDLTLKPLGEGLPPEASSWYMDGSELRAALSQRDGRERLHWKAPGSSEWAVIHDHDVLHRDFTPRYIEADGSMIVTSQARGDNSALYVYDPRARRLGAEPLVAVKGFDVGNHLVIDYKQRQVVGVHGMADGPFSVWFDEGLQSAQKQVDAALPGRRNRLLCGNCTGAKMLVVHSSSDRQSGEYYTYDVERRRLMPLGEERPWLPEATQGRRSFHRVAARDGLSMPVVVTHPPGSSETQPLPAVVLVHGGPWVRGATLVWEWQPQFLASRGYRVLEVDFRGSIGLGWKHYQAGWQQWGLAMQDDLVDALDWAVGQKLVDPKRVCIAGSSYGGYAALMGPVRHPDRYRCAISYAGVTDLALMFDTAGTDILQHSRQHSLPRTIGDPVRDAERLKQTSPVHRVRDIKVPVLIAQGRVDQRVKKTHADRFVSAAKEAGVDVEHVQFVDEGHSWNDEVNRIEFLKRVEAMLARTLKP